MTSPHDTPAPRQVTRPTPVVGRVTPRGGDGQHPRRLRRLNEVWINSGYPRYFLTICVQGRKRVLATETIHQRLLTFLQGSPERYGWWPTRYVIMPDHLHLLVCANPDGVALGAWVKALKAFVATSEFRWQKSFFDHVIRHDESETEKWEYVRQNPVRAGLVAKVEDWPYAGEIPEYPAPRQVTRPTITQKRAVPLVKVCGITNLDDARLAAELGADMLGFIFYAKSPRAVSREAAAQICRTVTVEKVGVFVNETEANIRQTFQECGLTALQFHGDESPAFCNLFSARKIKAIRVRDAESLRTASEYDVDALLLDTYTDTQRGGTGKTFDWSLAVQAKTLGKPIILSGGLAPDNVRDAIRTVQPYAVDVASGVEREPGRKDTEKLRRFFEACRNP